MVRGSFPAGFQEARFEHISMRRFTLESEEFLKNPNQKKPTVEKQWKVIVNFSNEKLANAR